MESSTHKQLAQSASQKANQANSKLAMLNREADSAAEEDVAGLKNKILSVASTAQGLSLKATEHRSDATRAELQESKEAFDQIDQDQEEIRKEEAKIQQKLETEAEQKAKLEKEELSPQIKEDFGEQLFALGDDIDFADAHVVEDVVDFSIANPTTAAIEDSTKSKTSEEEGTKAVTNSSGTNT